MSDGIDLLLLCLFTILIPVCLVFNALVFAVIYRSKSLRIPMNNLIFNLAITDFVIGLFIFPRHVLFSVIALRHPVDTTGNYFCKFITGSGTCGLVPRRLGFYLLPSPSNAIRP